MGIKNHTLGEVRYLTYEMMFPDGEHWVDQEHFFGPLDTWLKLTSFTARPNICIDLLRKGVSYWKDHNNVTHKVSIETVKRPRVWGTKGKRA